MDVAQAFFHIGGADFGNNLQTVSFRFQSVLKELEMDGGHLG